MRDALGACGMGTKRQRRTSSLPTPPALLGYEHRQLWVGIIPVGGMRINLSTHLSIPLDIPPLPFSPLQQWVSKNTCAPLSPPKKGLKRLPHQLIPPSYRD